MKKPIKTYLQKYSIEISDETIDLFLSIIKYKSFSKGDIIIEEGKATSKFYILQEGLIASFVKNKDKNDFIRTLYTKGKAIGALSSLIKQSASNASYSCLTDCKVFECDYNQFNKLRDNYKEFNLMYTKVLEETHIRTEAKIDEICSLNATERYLKLTDKIPNIGNLLPQYQIANYLNITPVQLSRIRKKMFSK